jgi:anti-anti-sigma factor
MSGSSWSANRARRRLSSLEIAVTPDRDRVYVAPVGELDLSNAADVRAEVDEVRGVGFDDIVLDLRQTSFIDSTVIRVVLELTQRSKGEGWRFRIVPGPPPVQRVFEITGVLDRLDLV